MHLPGCPPVSQLPATAIIQCCQAPINRFTLFQHHFKAKASSRLPALTINSTFSGPGGALLLSDVMSTRAVALSTPTAAQMFPTSQRLQRGMQLPPVRKHLGSVGGPKCRGDHLIGKSVHVGRNRRAAVWNLSSGQTTRDPAQLRSPPHEYEMRPLFAAVNSQPFPTLPPSRPPLNRARSRCIAGGLAVASAAATASVSKPKDQVMTPRHSSLDSDLDLSRDSGSDASASSAASMPAIAGSWRKDKQASDMEVRSDTNHGMLEGQHPRRTSSKRGVHFVDPSRFALQRLCDGSCCLHPTGLWASVGSPRNRRNEEGELLLWRLAFAHTLRKVICSDC